MNVHYSQLIYTFIVTLDADHRLQQTRPDVSYKSEKVQPKLWLKIYTTHWLVSLFNVNHQLCSQFAVTFPLIPIILLSNGSKHNLDAHNYTCTPNVIAHLSPAYTALYYICLPMLRQ